MPEKYQDARRSMLETDGPRHQALRSLIQRDFSPRALNGYESFLRELTKQTIDAALEKDEFDFIEEISADLPIQVLARMLDVPSSDTPQLIAWGNEFVANTDPDFTEHRLDDPSSAAYEHLPFRTPTVQEVWDYGRKLKEERTGGSGTDLISVLANKMPSDGVPLTEKDFDNYFTLLVIAGNETTRHAMSNIMYGLLQQPDQLAMLLDDPGKFAPAVEELLRWASPIYHFRRTATVDTELNGTKIAKGDKVVMWFASGNRDESVFPDPYKIDITRKNVDNMTFGKGSTHVCLGNNLARMEIRLVFEELLPRLKSIELNGEAKRIRSNFVNGMKQFPVKITRR